MNVLSLCDGMSCGQIALKELGIKVDKYYASEIDTNAIKVTQANFPSTIQLGDLKGITTEMLDKLPKIDLVLFGSPCRSLSKASQTIVVLKENEIEIQFTNENSFIEKMKLDNFQKCMDIYSSMQEQQGKIISVKELMKKIFNYSDEEIQNILNHYKRLGRNEDRYVESFDNIVSQYTDEQLKVIIKWL